MCFMVGIVLIFPLYSLNLHSFYAFVAYGVYFKPIVDAPLLEHVFETTKSLYFLQGLSPS